MALTYSRGVRRFDVRAATAARHRPLPAVQRHVGADAESLAQSEYQQSESQVDRGEEALRAHRSGHHRAIALFRRNFFSQLKLAAAKRLHMDGLTARPLLNRVAPPVSDTPLQYRRVGGPRVTSPRLGKAAAGCLLALAVAAAFARATHAVEQGGGPRFSPTIPRAWVESDLESM